MIRRRLTRLVSLAMTVAFGALPAASPVVADTPAPPAAITAWASGQVDPLTSTDPAAPLDDLTSLRRSVHGADVVGLGEAAHGAAELTTLKHRTLRLLVEQLGFRTVAWEEDWTTGVEIDAYIHGGPQDLSQLVASMSPQYQTGEVADVLAWLRRFNTGRRDQVSFVGVEYYFTRRLAYDIVEEYVAVTAPDLLGELRQHLDPLRPTSDDPFEHIETYTVVADKQPYLDNAHATRELVAGISPHRRVHDHAIALHAADQIVSFHEHYAMTEADNAVYREERAAQSLRWWQRLSGDRVAYWAASPHSVDARKLRLTRPDDTDLRFASAGSYLRDWYGRRYLSIGFTFDRGSVAGDAGAATELDPPQPSWFEAPLGAVPHATFSLDLRHCRVPEPVRTWLHDPVTTRGVSGPGSVVEGGTLAEWFDVVVHTQQVHPAQPR